MTPAGILKLCMLINTADKGNKPEYRLTELARYYYSDKSLGINRSHFARQDGIQIDDVVRCHNCRGSEFEIGAYVILDDGRQMQISDVNDFPDIDMTDLTLKRVNNYYDVTS